MNDTADEFGSLWIIVRIILDVPCYGVFVYAYLHDDTIYGYDIYELF